MADVQAKRKITVSARLDHGARKAPSRPPSPTKVTRPPSPTKIIRPPSPTKPSPSTPTSTTVTPTARPRAKVSSSATVSVRKPAGGLAPAYPSSGTSTPRAPSPVKQLEAPHGRLSPKPLSVPRIRSRTNVMVAASAPSSPLVNSHSTQAAIPATFSESTLVKASPPRVRHASISSMSQISSVSSARTSSLLSPSSSVVSGAQDSDSQSSVSPMRIKAKVSGAAKNKAPALDTASPMSSPPNYISSPTSQGHQRIGRTASISSLSSKEPQVWPITTATQQANIHRFATVRTPTSYRSPQSFASPLQTEHRPTHVDPALVPLPPLSPPSSTVSFSSQASTSRSSVSSAVNSTVPTFNINGPFDFDASEGLNGRVSKSRSNSIVVQDEDVEEKKIRAEAKSNRKIADLEITNKSLLAINAQLEASKHKQAKEIRELRRKLRESRLSLPPRAYLQLKSSNGVDDFASDDEEEDEDEDEANKSAEAIRIGKEDELFNRVRGMINDLLENGKRALETKAEDFAPPKGNAKVLHEVEARSWRDRRSSARSRTRDSMTGDDTFDESFITADSGDEAAESYPLNQNGSTTNESSMRSETGVEAIVGDLSPTANS